MAGVPSQTPFVVSTSLACCIFAFLLSACFTLGTFIQPRTDSWSRRGQADGLMQRVFGEGRRLFANHFFVQADVYFHSGFYPSIFDQQSKPKDTAHLREAGEGHAHEHDEHCAHPAEDGAEVSEQERHEEEHYRQMAMAKPRDWIEAFGRHFMVTEHKHLSGGNEREMLPWLKLSAEMDPQRIDTYTVAAYWLQNMGKVSEAEEFLRLGLKNNPDSYELLTDLALLLERRKQDDFRAANLLKLAMSKWQREEAGKEKPDNVGLDTILVHLAKIEVRAGNKAAAADYLRKALEVSPSPEAIRKQLDELKAE